MKPHVFHLILIKPTHYDDDGYPIQWVRTQMPSNSMACLIGLARDCADRRVLGDDVEIQITSIDETGQRVRVDQLVQMVRRSGGRAMVGLVGVQTNQFPRAVDLAKKFLAEDLQVCIGGFHVSGCLSMLDELPPEIVAAQEMGISMFAGEAEEGRFESVLIDAYAGQLKPLYNYLDDVPSISDQPVPRLNRNNIARTFSQYGAFDLGRGCPYRCSYCTIINVQGRKSRFRTPDDLERIIRANHAEGIHRFFLTDDNLARNANWEPLFDRLIKLREEDGIEVRFIAQVDMVSHRIKGFIDKAVKAGVDQLFMGMESINKENLKSVKKSQNRVADYREALLAWKKHAVVITAGYILGFPGDTKASIISEIETVKRELPIDALYFFFLTPLPGSADHQQLTKEGVWMDGDPNKYDLDHRVTHHPTMSDAEWEETYEAAWNTFYTFEHMETVFKRLVALGSNKKLTTLYRLLMYKEFVRYCGVHALEGGLWRVRVRTDRRPGLPLEPRVKFYSRHFYDLARYTVGMLSTYVRLRRILKRAWTDPNRYEYRDAAITMSEDADAEPLVTDGGKKKRVHLHVTQQAS